MIKPRFTIGWLMIAVALVAVPLVVWRSLPLITIVIQVSALGLGLGLTWVGHWLSRERPGRAVVGLVLVTAGVIGFLGWINAVEPSRMIVLLALMLISPAVVPPMLALCLVLGQSLGSIRAGWRRNWAVAVLVGAPLLAGSAFLLNWPFHVLFWLARGDLESLARRAERGQTITCPVRAGAFTIRGVNVNTWRPGYVFLLTEPRPGKQAGFLRRVDPAVMSGAGVVTTSAIGVVSFDGVWVFDDWD